MRSHQLTPLFFFHILLIFLNKPYLAFDFETKSYPMKDVKLNEGFIYFVTLKSLSMKILKQLLADESALLSANALQAVKGGDNGSIGGPPLLEVDPPDC